MGRQLEIVYGVPKNFTGRQKPSSIFGLKRVIYSLRQRKGRSSFSDGLDDDAYDSDDFPNMHRGQSFTHGNRTDAGSVGSYFGHGTAYIVLGVLAGIAVCAIIYCLIRHIFQHDNNNQTAFHTRMPNTASAQGARRGAVHQQQEAVPIEPETAPSAPARNVSSEAVEMRYDGGNTAAYSAAADTDADDDGQQRNGAGAQAAQGNSRENITGNPTPLQVAVQVESIGGVYIGEDNYVQI